MVYTIISNSYNLIEEELKKIITEEKDKEIINYSSSNIKDIIEKASYVSLFQDKNIIIVKHSSFLVDIKDKDLEILIKYLDNPNSLTTLIFIYMDKVDERKKVIKELKTKGKFIKIKELKPLDITYRIMDEVKKHNLNIEYDDAAYITNKCLNNYDLVEQELSKVYLYYETKAKVIKDDLQNIISNYTDDNNFKFVDAVVSNDKVKAIKILEDYKLKKEEPIVLVNLLAREYRLMLQAKAMNNNGLDNKSILQELGLIDWQLDKLLKNSYTLSYNELEDKLISLANLDYDIKKGTIDKFLGLELFILK